MAHKTLIGGTAYNTKSGKAFIGGTGYSIKKGRTLIGGTGYDVKFGLGSGVLFEGGTAISTPQYIRGGSNGNVTVAPTARIENNYIYSQCGQSQVYTPQTGTVNAPQYYITYLGPVSLTGYSTLHILASGNANGGYFGYSNSAAATLTSSKTFGSSMDATTTAEVTMDISSVSGDKYIGFYPTPGQCWLKVYKIWLT